MAGQSRRGQTSKQQKKKRSSGRRSDASETSGKSFHCLLVYSITASALRLALEQVALLAGQIVLRHPDLKNVLPQTCTCRSLGIAAAEKSPVPRGRCDTWPGDVAQGNQNGLPSMSAEKTLWKTGHVRTHDELATVRGYQIIHI